MIYIDKIYIKQIDKSFYLELCKVNREVIGVIDSKCIKSIKKSILEANMLELEIPKYIYINRQKTLNPIWYEIKEERLVLLNNKEYYVLKSNSLKSSTNTKSFTAYSLEYKLSKIDVKFEDIFIRLIEEDTENNIYSINNLLLEDTGWSFGYIDENILYDFDENSNKTEKIRHQESINKRWYDYIKQDICELFGCIADFDTLNKKVNLYDIKKFGENIELYLSKDNYLKDIERTGSSENIVTRLYLVGQEEMDIIGATVSGYPYLENYDYFFEEMSEELKNQIKKYNEMVSIREPIWKDLINTKNTKLEELYRNKTDLYMIYQEIKAKTSIKENYDAKNDKVNSSIVVAEITKLNDEKTILEVKVSNLEKDISNLENSIKDINILCKRETATNEEGYLIFNKNTLEELKEFVYCNTYVNDSFLDVNDLIKAGKRELKLSAYPTVSYKLDLENFINNVNKNSFNNYWEGFIGLGDIVILKDDDLDKEVFLYVNSYTQYPNDEKEIDIELSNKKLIDTNIRVIADRLKEAELSSKMLKRKVHLLNKQKYNKINIQKEQIGGNI